MFNENTMLQTENDKLRQRIKSLHETIESLTVRNTQLLVEKDLLGISNVSGTVTVSVGGGVKCLHETIESLTVRNTQLLVEKDLLDTSYVSSKILVSIDKGGGGWGSKVYISYMRQSSLCLSETRSCLWGRICLEPLMRMHIYICTSNFITLEMK